MRWQDLSRHRVPFGRSTLRYALVVGSLAFAERLLLPAAAWTLFTRPMQWKAAVGMTLAVAFTLRTFVERLGSARAEAELTERVTSAVLGGNVLSRSVLADDDARAELGQGIYLAAQLQTQELPHLTADVAASAVVAIVISIVEPLRLIAIAMLVAIVAGATLAWSRGHAERSNATAWALQKGVIALLVDALEGRTEIVASGQRLRFEAEMARRARAWASASVHVAASAVVAGRLPLLAIAGAVAVAVGLDAGEASIRVNAADVAIFASVAPTFAGIAQRLMALVRNERWGLVVHDILQRARPRESGGRSVPDAPDRIEFDRVSFAYDGSDDLALHEVTFGSKRDSILALAGANGSGKSTCLSLLLALASPRGGRVVVGGSDLRQLDADSWRSHLAFLPQRPYLPPRSNIRTAVALLAPSATEERMRRALARVGLTGPHGRSGLDLDCPVDSLSVGQRQRVALARMLCRDASLYVLDEPDANLDRAGIALVADLIRELVCDKRQVIFAAHTEELLATADQVVYLEDGRVVTR